MSPTLDDRKPLASRLSPGRRRPASSGDRRPPRPSPVEAWLFAAATDPGDGIDCAHVVGWLRLRRALGDDAGLVDPETARHWHERLGEPPRSSTPRWARRVRSVARDAEPPGFGLPPRRVAAFCAHPAWVRPYLRCATFKAWLVAAEDPELAELPPPPSPGPVPGGARALPASPLQS